MNSLFVTGQRKIPIISRCLQSGVNSLYMLDINSIFPYTITYLYCIIHIIILTKVSNSHSLIYSTTLTLKIGLKIR